MKKSKTYPKTKCWAKIVFWSDVISWTLILDSFQLMLKKTRFLNSLLTTIIDDPLWLENLNDPKDILLSIFFSILFKWWKISNTYGNNGVTKPLKGQCPASMVIATWLALFQESPLILSPRITSKQMSDIPTFYLQISQCPCTYIYVYTHTDIHTSVSSPPLSSITLLYLVVLKCPSWKNECQTKNSVIYTMFCNV